MTTPACPDCPDYSGHRFPAEVISHAVWCWCAEEVVCRSAKGSDADQRGKLLIRRA